MNCHNKCKRIKTEVRKLLFCKGLGNKYIQVLWVTYTVCNSLKTWKSSLACVWLASRTGFPGGSDGKESACSVEDLGLIPGLCRYPGEGNSYSLKYSDLENSTDRRTWQATVHGVAKELDTTKQLNMNAHTLDVLWWNSTLLPPQSHEPSLT